MIDYQKARIVWRDGEWYAHPFRGSGDNYWLARFWCTEMNACAS